MNAYDLSTQQAALLILIVIWDLAWRGVALWRAAQAKHKTWFIILLVINSIGILPILYLLTHPKKS